MSATFKGTLKKDKRKNNLEYPVYLRITYNRDNRYYHLGFNVNSSDWSQKTGRVKSSHYSSKVFNNRIERAEHKGQKAFFEIEDKIGRAQITPQMILDHMRGGNRNDFFAYAQKQIERLEANGQVSQFKQHRTLLNKVKHFHGDKPLPFEQITVTFLNDFENFLTTEYNNAVNTIYSNFKIFRRIIKRAVQEDLLAYEDNPFHRKKLKREKTHKTKLSLEQIKTIHDIDVKQGTRLYDAKNTFLFSFYCAGIRFGDLCELKWKNINDGWLSYEMSKTGKKKEIWIVPQAQNILDLYDYEGREDEHFIFPLLDNKKDYSDVVYLKKQIESKNALINRYLKKVAKRADIPKKVSCHTSRHSFAAHAQTKRKLSLSAISELLGHSDLKTTDTYLKQLDKKRSKENINIVFNSKES